MKKFISISGFISSILAIAGMIMKMQHFGGAGICVVLGFGFLMLLFLPFYGYNLLYELTNKKSKIAGVFGSLLFIFISAGALFKIQHWPGAGAIYIIEFIILCFLLLPILMIIKIKSSESVKEKFLHFFWYLSLMVISLGYCFKVQHFPFAGMLLFSGTILIALGYIPLAFKIYNNDENRSKLYNRFVIIVCGLVFVLLVTAGTSGYILNSFVDLNKGITQTTNFLNENNNRAYKTFTRGNTEDSENQYQKAMKVKELSKEMFNHIEKLKIHLMQTIDKTQNDSIQLSDVDGKDNYDVPTKVLVGDPENPNKGAFSGLELKAKIAVYKLDLISLIDEKKNSETSKMLGLNINDSYSEDEARKIPWEVSTFNYFPIAGVITTLSKLQSDIKIAESVALEVIRKKYIGTYNY